MVPLTLDGLSMSLCPRLVSGLRPPRDTRPRSASETKACRAEWSSLWLLRQCQAISPTPQQPVFVWGSLPGCIQAVRVTGTRWEWGSLDIWNRAPCLSRTSFFSPANLTSIPCFGVYKALIQSAFHPMLPSSPHTIEG